ncbi:Crp/Fnr family transcriptional regulator [Stakelama sp. CBK3Z-3]|uniref:Crp/Fnr family transcriptional regulator n=1 Tax=Stakelama flava TaxID=2860338 RepID=A0ABS6XQZ7_9SPHN|nr:Crp/Fnr family transcriptional regulator [Stakelama flava]MBW4332218.1 Crp/Fnr family transcriptional regulator [Stakelama flava]
MFTGRFLANRRGVALLAEERALLESAISEVRTLEPRLTLVRAGEVVGISTLLVEGMMSRYIDDQRGLRQLVAVHVAGEFVDLHAYPMHRLDHSIGTLTAATVAIMPHDALQEVLTGREEFARKLWFATLLDAALHRAWLFRLGRLDAVGRVAHFLSETNARLQAVGLSDGRRFALGLTQTDIAEVCGLTTVHTNRAIRQLREAGLCILKSASVEIPDSEGLAKRGDFDPDYLYLDTPR